MEGRGGKVQLGDEAREDGNAHHGQGPHGEHAPGGGASMGGAPEAVEVLMPAGDGHQVRAGQEQHGLGQGMGYDLEQHRPQGGLRSHAQAHEDIADLGGGGEGDHGGQPPGENGGDGACDHAADAEQQQHRLDARGGEHVNADDLVDDLDEKHDIPLGHHAGQDARGGRGGLAVGIRHPQVEGEQAALDGQSRGHQAQGHGHGEPVPAGGPQVRDGGVQLGEQQVAGDGIGEDHAHEEQTRAHQGEDHVPGGGDQCPAAPTHRQQGAGGDGQDLDEHVAGEDIVGVAQGYQRHMGQVHHDPIELLLVGGDVLQDAAHTAQHTQQHDPGKQHGQEGLQNTRRQLVAPGGGVVAHHIIVADVVHRAVYQHGALQHDAG